jgi:predicted dehydrogenase
VSEEIRVGIIGAGANTRARHIPGLQAIPGVRVDAVCNRSRASSERVAGQFGIPRAFDRWEDLARDDTLDAIVIGTWPDLHAPATLAALEAGKHVLCEARMALNAREARAMLEAAQARPRLTAQVVPSPFTLHVDDTVRRLLDEGRIGRPLAVQVRVADGAFLDPAAPLHWRQDRRRSGVNVLSLGIWYEAVMRWVGEADRVSAMGRAFVRRRRDPETGADLPAEVPEHVDVLAAMRCGAQALFSISAVAGLVPSREAVVLGTEGTLRFADGRLYAGRRGDKALAEVPTPPAASGWRVEEEFIGAIRGVAPVRRTTFEDGVRYMDFTEAADLSIREGRIVSLPL